MANMKKCLFMSLDFVTLHAGILSFYTINLVVVVFIFVFYIFSNVEFVYDILCQFKWILFLNRKKEGNDW